MVLPARDRGARYGFGYDNSPNASPKPRGPERPPNEMNERNLQFPKMSDSHRRSAPSSCALVTCENAPHTNGYASAFRKHQSIKSLAHLIRQNRPSQESLIRRSAPFLAAVREILPSGFKLGEVRSDRPLDQLAPLLIETLTMPYAQHRGSAGALPTLEEAPSLAVSAFLDGAGG